MSMSDPLADMLTRIRNAGMVKFKSVDIPFSKVKVGVAGILKKEGYIIDFQIMNKESQDVLRIDLKYDQHQKGVIRGLRRMSRPGKRMYISSNDIPSVMSGLGIAILSTSKGIMSGKEAKNCGVGGELLCEVW